MRRKVLQATLAALAAAVLLLGIPLGVFAFQLVRDDALRDLDSRTASTARAVEVRYRSGERLDEQILGNFLGSASGAPKHVIVTLPDGTSVQAGREPQPSFRSSVVTDDGVVVIMSIARQDVLAEASKAVALVAAVGLVAIIAAVAVALWQANRLAAPMIYLAAAAEQIGSGQTRLAVRRSGVEEIDLVADELGRSAERTAARLAAERQFASDASHQLRTPLTALSMRLEEIASATTQDEVRLEAEASLEQVERLVGVVDDLLGRTRRSLGAGTALVSLAAVCEQVKTEWSPAFAKARRQLVVVPADGYVFASPGGLTQVLATLVENSLIHGGGTTTVAARSASATSRGVVVEVKDEGAGIDEELAGKIFDRGVSSGKGTGLGLALARDLAAADGGRLELSQRVPAVFHLFLQPAPRGLDVEDLIPHGKSHAEQTSRRRRGARG